MSDASQKYANRVGMNQWDTWSLCVRAPFRAIGSEGSANTRIEETIPEQRFVVVIKVWDESRCHAESNGHGEIADNEWHSERTGDILET